ncbi:MAG: hypothetical protein A2W91_15350 [Bacteroidetes bacterium GWF2_38_335]|nr:MAG: hypothetical protein A2W91_15350 [Bacteroidetes bacterium GWF2_38_335]OFY81046.1 MAG: hypothetical protein A2281_13130 [Bacteroidetes bacterium RIFOXYA12_FULL_38_20]HBS87638.1 hypothetical protein [Bacteroidales bacterium]
MQNRKKNTEFFEKKAGALFEKAGRNYYATIFLAFVFMSLLMIFYKPQVFGRILDHDAFFYLIKAFEINDGNFTPLHFQSEGWSVILAFFLKIFSIQSFSDGMVFSRYLSVFIMALCLIPFALIVKKVLGKELLLPALVVFTICNTFVHNGASGNTESLFFFVFLYAVYFLIRSYDNPKFLYYAAAFGSLAYFIRPNGLFFLIIIILVFVDLYRKKKAGFKFLLISAGIFILVSLPHLYMRHAAWGSPFDYGVNSKYFAGSPSQIWAENIQPVSFLSWMSDHSIGEMVSKFITFGLFAIFKELFVLLGEFWFVLLLTGCLYYLIIKRESKLFPVIITVGIFIAGLIPVYQVYGVPRHLFMIIPVALIVGLKLFNDITEKQKYKNILMFLLISIIFIFNVPVITIYEFNKMPGKFEKPILKDEWVRWADENLEGNIAVGNKKQAMFIMLGIEKSGDVLYDIGKIRNAYHYKLFNPGYYENMSEGIRGFEKDSIRFLIVNEEMLLELPYLREAYGPEWKNSFKLIYTVNSMPDRMYPQVDIFEITY